MLPDVQEAAALLSSPVESCLTSAVKWKRTEFHIARFRAFKERLVCVCALPLSGFIQAGGSLFSVGVLEPIPFSKRAGSAWHARRLLPLCYRLCWL